MYQARPVQLSLSLIKEMADFSEFLCRAGYLPQSIPLEIVRYLSEEKDFLPWHAASRALYPLDKLLDRMEKYNIFNVKRYIFFFLLFRR